MIKINVISSNILWKKTLKNPQSYFDKKLKKINFNNNLFKKKKLVCSLLLSDSKEIKRLNKKFRKKNKSTDILSFPFYKKNELYKKIKEEKEVYIGDIIINLNELQNTSGNKGFEEKLNKLWIHGLIHLFGYKHKSLKDYKSMSKIEKKYLQYMN
tara:strand:- start:229 stop:693 length:465 start_codon:yes stop_codon:yes gene_type:complete